MVDSKMNPLVDSPATTSGSHDSMGFISANVFSLVLTAKQFWSSSGRQFFCGQRCGPGQQTAHVAKGRPSSEPGRERLLLVPPRERGVPGAVVTREIHLPQVPQP
ncbi:hypothetical protein CAPTEDRAFT_203747 [Capitella teleta]|uniref:Uncharacterized protein n=1 Tax=Capitella teleta TaxID=283909 RepID=R7VFG2_CAPTE|nr:hypothetical protein CAPTEDRAFT_203747 [Capitella teleta]|eukprot:ELU17354.1 hypothetical protein CAPTEDRAFT_203747 [Capitella teleta]